MENTNKQNNSSNNYSRPRAHSSHTSTDSTRSSHGNSSQYTRSSNRNSTSQNRSTVGYQGQKSRSFGSKPKSNRRPPSLRSTLRQQRNTKIAERQKARQPIPSPGKNIRIITIGGVEEIGKNMLAIEIGNDIIIVDAGFQFKDASTPGIDYILPNTDYLEERKDKIRGLFITHGHLDHIGAIPYVLGKLGNPPIYSRKFGAIMIQKKMEDFPHLPKPDIKIIDGDEIIRVGEIRVETFPISHTIPDSMGLIVNTVHGDLVIIEDVRVDNIDGVPTDEEADHYKRFKDRNILLLTMDSTSIEKPGFSISENVVVKNIEKIIKETSSRLIIGTFASQVERILAIIEMADKYGKKIVVEGRSMKSNLEIVKYLGLIKTENVIPISEIEKYPPDRIVMLVTGAQGEEFAALMRMANKSHKFITLKKTDTILLSSSIIPTNHTAVVKLKDSLYRSEAKVITYLDSDVHASGHGNRGELKWIHQQIPYKYFVPLHGFHYMLRQHAEMAESLGVKPENIIVPENGSIIEILDENQQMVRLPVRAPHDPVTVDGLAVGTIQDVVLEDRQLLAEAGIFMVVVSLNVRTGKLKKSPDIISRGFVYLRESQELLRKARFITQKIVETQLEKNTGPVDFDKLKKSLSDELTKFLFQETAKQPLVISVIIGV
ncbi:MAG TPA: ribonuclease J [Candidatus Paceibacterota bacterium]|nr:ribonuclease J [Candidatus Paceibacterota bacterium]